MAYVNNKLAVKRCSGKMLDVEVVKRKNMYHFHENDEEYLKIIMQFPSDVTTYRDYLHTVQLPSLLHSQFGSNDAEFKNYRAVQEAKLLNQPLPTQTTTSGLLYRHDIFEAKLPFILRFMVDHSIVGCNWLELTPGNYRLLSAAEKV